MAQAQVPLFFDGQDFRVCSALNYVAAAVLDPLVVLTDGSKAFTAPLGHGQHTFNAVQCGRCPPKLGGRPSLGEA